MENDPRRADSPAFDFLELPPPQDSSAIRVLPGNSTDIGVNPSDRRPRATFAHVQVINSGPFAPRVRCGLRFFRRDGSQVFAQEMPGRWSGAPEPLTVVAVPGQGKIDHLHYVPDLSKVPAGYARDLATKEQDTIAVAVKFNDGTCWGWTPESYMHNFRHRDWQLPSEPLRVVVRVTANGIEYTEDFDIDASAPPDDFATRSPAMDAAAADLRLTRGIQPEAPTRPDRTDVERLQ